MSGNTDRAFTRAILLLILGACCVSFAPVFVKMLGHGTIGLTAIAFWRMALGGMILCLVALVRRAPLSLPRSAYPWAALAGFLFFLDLAFWHRSIMYAGAGLSTILANTQVFNTAVLSYLFLKEKLTLRFFIAGVSAMVGIILLVGTTSGVNFTEEYLLGIVFGLITGVVYAGYLVTLKRASRQEEKPDFMTFMAWVCLFSAVFLGAAVPFEEGRFIPSDAYTWMVLILLAFVVQGLGWWVIYRSLQKIEASRAGLVLLMQPALATIWGVLFFTEHLAVGQVFGAVVTLVAIYFGATHGRRSASPHQ